MKSRLAKLTAAALLALTAMALPLSAARAEPITTDEWFVFNFGDDGSQFGDCTGSCDLLGYDTPAPPWTITLGEAATLIFVDGFQSGDTFRISVNDGTGPTYYTSGVASSTGSTCFSAADCLADSDFDRVIITLAAGTYSISGDVLDSPFGSGAAFFMVDTARTVNVAEPSPNERPPIGGNPFPIPEPASLALLGLALVAFSGSRRLSGK